MIIRIDLGNGYVRLKSQLSDGKIMRKRDGRLFSEVIIKADDKAEYEEWYPAMEVV